MDRSRLEDFHLMTRLWRNSRSSLLRLVSKTASPAVKRIWRMIVVMLSICVNLHFKKIEVETQQTLMLLRVTKLVLTASVQQTKQARYRRTPRAKNIRVKKR